MSGQSQARCPSTNAGPSDSNMRRLSRGKGSYRIRKLRPQTPFTWPPRDADACTARPSPWMPNVTVGVPRPMPSLPHKGNMHTVRDVRLNVQFGSLQDSECLPSSRSLSSGLRRPNRPISMSSHQGERAEFAASAATKMIQTCREKRVNKGPGECPKIWLTPHELLFFEKRLSFFMSICTVIPLDSSCLKVSCCFLNTLLTGVVHEFRQGKIQEACH
jgi:hypothetical protein